MKHTTWHDALRNENSITTLTLLDDDVLRLDNNIAKLKYLRILILHNTRWVVVPPGEKPIGILKVPLPDHLGTVLDLEELILINSYIDRLPDTVVNLKKLKYLKIAYTDNAQMDQEVKKISQLDLLERLDISGSLLTKSSLQKLRMALRHVNEVVVEPELS